ncbi:MAG: tetratricopeptide repeat protein [Pseudomonadota bacterium]
MSLDANLAEAYEAAGLLATMRGTESDLLEAESFLRRAIALNPSLVNARSWLSTALQTMNRKQEAMEVLEEAIRIDPLNGVMNLNLGKRYQEDGQLDRARAQMERAMRFPDTGAYGWFWIADLETTRGHYDRALQFMKNATLNGGFDNELYQWHAGVIAVYYARLGVIDQARVWQEHYNMPEVTDWHFSQDYNFAIATDDRPALRKLMEQHQQIVSASNRPLSLMLRSTLGRLAARLGDYEKSIELLAPIFEGDWTYQNAPGGGQDTVDTLLFYAVSLQKTGRGALAESLLQTALERLQADYAGATALPAIVPVRQALIYSLLGDYDTAIENFRRGVEAGWRDSFVVSGNPCWDELRHDEEFQRLLKLINDDLSAQRDKVRVSEQLQPFLPR